MAKEQKEQFAKIYFKAAPEKSKSFIKAIEAKPQIKALSSNPLLLNLMCIVYERDELKLPTRRIDLYEKVTEKMLEEYFIKRDTGEIKKYGLDELCSISKKKY